MPDNLPSLPPFYYKTDARLENINISEGTVQQILNNLNIGSATGPDGIGNRILRATSQGIASHLCVLFQYLVDISHFPSQWKIANISPVFKKGKRSKIENYRPISLLCNISKVFEKTLHMHVSNYLYSHNLIHENQAAYKPGDSTICQLTEIVHNVHLHMEEGHEVRMVFLDISKAFDCTWHNGLLYKLKQLGIQGSMLKLIQSYLSDRSQRVVIRGQSSNTVQTEAGVPQGSILGPLLFLVYINDLSEVLLSNIRMYADDVLLEEVVLDPYASAISLNSDLTCISKWSKQWLLKFNPEKCKTMLFSSKKHHTHHPSLWMNGVKLEEVSSHKHLGLTLASNLSWNLHIDNIHNAAAKRLGILRHVTGKVPRKTLEHLYKVPVRPCLEYGCTVWGNCNKTQSHTLESLQNEAAHLCTGAMAHTSIEKLQNELGWPSLSLRRQYLSCVMFHSIMQGNCPQYLQELAPNSITQRHQRILRNTQESIFVTYICRTKRFEQSFFPSSTVYFNSLSSDIRNEQNPRIFKRKLQLIMFPPKPPSYFSNSYEGSRSHTQFRLEMCPLNYYLYKIGCVESAVCTCGFKNETISHFLLECPIHAHSRRELLQTITPLFHKLSNSNVPTNLLHFLLYGSDELSYLENTIVFKNVGQFITASKRI